MSTATIRQDPTLPLLPAYNVSQHIRDVAHILDEAPFLIPFLNEVANVIRAHFPDAQRLDLKPSFAEPDSLLVSIITGAPDAVARLSRFDETWWIEASERAQDRLHVDIGRR